MEARARFGRTGISKLFVGVVLAIVAVGLGIMAAYLASNLTSTGGAAQPVNSTSGSGDQPPADYQPAHFRGGIQE